jgi:peroxiredoxin
MKLIQNHHVKKIDFLFSIDQWLYIILAFFSLLLKGYLVLKSLQKISDRTYFIFLVVGKEMQALRGKFFAIVLLLGLIGWGIYDHYSKEKNDEKFVSQQKTAEETLESDHKHQVGIKKGNMAPDFTLSSLDGKVMKLSDLKGKKVILNFWASWCPPCKAEIPHMQSFYEDEKDNHVVILAVNLTTAEKNTANVEQFVKEYGITFPVLLDSQGEIGNVYQAFTIPTSYIIDSNGVIQQKIVGPMSKEMMKDMISSIN